MLLSRFTPLPPRWLVQTVYLSKNSLRALSGLEQFRALRNLSLADNLLARWEDLQPLTRPGAFPSLETLSVEGNPLFKLPNYRWGGAGRGGLWADRANHFGRTLSASVPSVRPYIRYLGWAP